MSLEVPSDASFQLERVSYTYDAARPKPGQAPPRLILRDVSLTIPGGCKVAVLGRSGSGKTTLLNLLGLLWDGKLAQGDIGYRAPGRAEPYDYNQLRAWERAHLRREHFGFVLQSSYLLPHFSCADNIALPLEMRGQRPKDWVNRLLRETEPKLEKIKDHLPGQVSGGERQRMAVLRAIVHDPTVVFADEPVSNLDPANANRVLDLLDQWHTNRLPSPSKAKSRPRTLILVSHDVPRAAQVADYLVLIDRDGRVVENRTHPVKEFRNPEGDLDVKRIDALLDGGGQAHDA